MKLKTLLLATSWAALSSFSVQALQETAEKEEVQSPPSLPGEVHSKIDSATPGLMPVKPLKDVPEDILALLDALPEAKREFVLSGKGASVLKPDLMYELMRKASTQEIEQYVDTMLTVYDQVQYKQGRDTDQITLNTDSENYNTWRVKRPKELDPEREAGPISLGRYLGGGRSGIPTFARSPVALSPEDLVAGEVDVAILGAPLDMGSGWRDAIHGPRAMRMLGRGTGGADVSTMIDPGKVLNIVDYGDAAIDQLSTERSVQEVRDRVREIAETGAIPFIIGGDHSLEYPNVAAIADVYGKGKVGVVHFDAHLDTGRGRVHLLDHGQPIYRLMKEAHVRPEDYIQVGLRAHYSKSYY